MAIKKSPYVARRYTKYESQNFKSHQQALEEGRALNKEDGFAKQNQELWLESF